MKRAFALVLAAMIFLSGCITRTNVTFRTSEPGAEVYLDHELIGTTPLEHRMSNGVWEDPDVLIRKEGYRDINTQLDKEIKPVNLIFGVLGWFPSFLWVYGPDNTQSYTLIEEEN